MSTCWEVRFVEVGLSLTTANLELCQAQLQERLDEYQQDLTWLSEIVEVASNTLAKKSSTLEQMPKTPCVKQKGRKRGRKKSRLSLKEELGESGTPVPSKIQRTLTFDTDSQDDDEKPPCSATGRSLRACRQDSKVTIVEPEDEVKSTRSTRTSTKPATARASRQKTAKAVKTEEEEDLVKPIRSTRNSRKPTRKAAASSVSNTDVESINETETAEYPAATKTQATVLSSESGTDRSPSVKERANAYETMIKVRASKSPVKPSRVNTPKTPIIATAKQKRSGSCSLKQQNKRSASRGSSTRKSKQSSLKKGKEPPRANRTRLRLKKQQVESTDTTDSEETEEVEKPVSSPAPKPMLPPKPPSLKKAAPTPAVVVESDTLNETEIMVTEVYEIHSNENIELKEFEMQKTKTMPATVVSSMQLAKSPVITYASPRPCLSSDQGFDDADDEDDDDEVDMVPEKNRSSSKAKSNAQLKEMASLNPIEVPDSPAENTCDDSSGKHQDTTFTKGEESMETSPVSRSTRTRARIQQEQAAAAKESVPEPACNTRTRQKTVPDLPAKDVPVISSDTTFTKDSEDSSPDQRSTRTRTRQQKEAAAEQESETIAKGTRTRQRLKQEAQSEESQGPSTRSRLRVPPAKNPSSALLLSDDEVVAGSPIAGTPQASLQGGKKRFIEERGSSPRPKRSRSCVGDASMQHRNPPLSTSSPIKRVGQEEDDILGSPCRLRKSPRVYQFNSAQKKTSGFLNRTPGFAQNTSRLYSFLNNSSGTPSMRQNALTSFLKRNTPPPKQTAQALHEQKKQKLLEKENKDRERLKKAAELRRKKVEEQRRQREEKARRVAEAKEQRMLQEQEQKQRLNKKLEQNAALKEKIMEERSKEEREKQKLRLKKQIEAEERRKIEEEERRKKQLEMEEEARQQEEFMQRKREHEEAERRRQAAEEKRRHEEKLADIEQRRQEEIARLKRQEEEKQQERERQRQEREKLLAMEKAERDRIEREKKEQKDKKLAEELEKLKALEKERLMRQAQEALKLQQAQEEIQKMQKMITQHNQTISHAISKPGNPPMASSTTTTAPAPTTNKGHSYDITPVKKKIFTSNNPDDYGIDDKGSDESTDDDEAPKKKIPEWALGNPLKIALIRQFAQPPDLSKIFPEIEPPNLELLFPGVRRRRFKERTSSAIWTSPVLKHC